MHFEQDYFDLLKYSKKEQLISRHVFECLKWAAQVTRVDLLDGKGRNALDVGCAFGYGVKLLQSFGYDAVGVDVSAYGLSQGKGRLREHVFVACDVQESLPFKKKFDLVICLEVLEHLRDPSKALKNMYDLSDEIVLCTTPNRTFEQVVSKVLKDFDRTHINVKTPSEWEEIIRKTLKCGHVEIQSFVDSSFHVANASFYKSLKLPFGMETRIVIQK